DVGQLEQKIQKSERTSAFIPWRPQRACCADVCAALAGGASDLEHVRADELELLWQPGPRGQLYAANTVDQALWMVRGFLRWAHRQGLLPRDPSRQLVLGRPVQPSPRLLTSEEVEQLLALPDLDTALGLRNRCILASQELCGLNLADLSLAERLVGGQPGRPYGLSNRLQELLGLYC
ncbi:MAG: hypothetical protein AB1758_03530, partial [Candidatus Eremiobacterota bacterium]